MNCARHPAPHDVWPVHIAAHAFAQDMPRHDLWLSPDHAVWVRGALVPVRYLLNGATLRQEGRAAVTYCHVELERHDVLLAEGLPAESYLDTGNRAAFAGTGTVVMAHANFARGVWKVRGCAPLLLRGPRVTAARRRLLARAEALGHQLSDAPALRVLAEGSALPVEFRGKRWLVRLPAEAWRVRLASRSWVPAETRPGGA